MEKNKNGEEEKGRWLKFFEYEFVDRTNGGDGGVLASDAEEAGREYIDEHEGGQGDNGGFEFRLFAAAAKPAVSSEPQELGSFSQPQASTSTGIHRIRIRSQTPMSWASGGGFVVPGRPRSYYFTDAAGTEQRKRARERFADAAVAGELVVGYAQSVKWVS